MKTALALLAIAIAANSQPPGPPKPALAMAAGAIGGIVTAFPVQPVVGHLYSAEQVTEHVQTLADGTRITQPSQTTRIYRDSAGRTRTEHTFTPPPGALMASALPLIQIADPVAGCRYMLGSRTRTARRTPWPSTMHRTNVPASENLPQPVVLPATTAFNGGGTRPRPDMSDESLGTQTIEGVLAEGTRMTVTHPVGFMGNDRPITTVTETWISPDLKTVLLSKVSDQRYGESVTKLTNIVVAEPDPALFQVPADYSIGEEPAPETRWSK